MSILLYFTFCKFVACSLSDAQMRFRENSSSSIMDVLPLLLLLPHLFFNSFLNSLSFVSNLTNGMGHASHSLPLFTKMIRIIQISFITFYLFVCVFFLHLARRSTLSVFRFVCRSIGKNYVMRLCTIKIHFRHSH